MAGGQYDSRVTEPALPALALDAEHGADVVVTDLSDLVLDGAAGKGGP
jgi:hypothetical protein